jgi:hypothetical protein
MPNLGLSDGDVTTFVEDVEAQSAAQERKDARRPPVLPEGYLALLYPFNDPLVRP